MKSNSIKLPILLILLAAIFYPVYPDLYTAWVGTSNSDNSYGILVPFISLYFVWNKKEELKRTVMIPSTSGLALLTISLLIYLVGYAGGVVFLQRMMIVLSLNGLILYVLGRETYKQLSFPLLFLFFMVPIPESVVNTVSFPLQTYATILSTKIIQWCGIPVYREGHMLYFSQTQLEVAEACSGIRSISALVMLSVIFMSQCKNNKLLKAIIVLSSVLIAFVANLLRVSGTGILAHFFGAVVARGFLHEFSGIAVFAFGLVVMFIEYKVLNRIWSQKN
ncbi:MAG: exosortase [Geobacter sp.]|nr:exosortase [Geobacter sp.]